MASGKTRIWRFHLHLSNVTDQLVIGSGRFGAKMATEEAFQAAVNVIRSMPKNGTFLSRVYFLQFEKQCRATRFLKFYVARPQGRATFVREGRGTDFVTF